MQNKMTTHNQLQFKNKTYAALLAVFGGSIGLYRFYLAGNRDKWAWLHVFFALTSFGLYFSGVTIHPFFCALPLIFSGLVGVLACLVIGTMSDEKWDMRFNATSINKSETGWTMALILVLTLGIGAGALIAVIARTCDLLFTGGLYG